MAIVFDWYENPNASSEEEAALHPRIFMNGKVDTDTLCYKIHDYSSLIERSGICVTINTDPD